jgi:YesN/AraC family two-component response regulator
MQSLILSDINQQEASFMIINEVLEYIKENYYQDFSLEMIAERTNFHPKYLGKLIKSTCNISYHQYLTKIRVNNAIELMEDPERKITDIYLKVGYFNRQSFTRAFKEHTSFTPAEFRSKFL